MTIRPAEEVISDAIEWESRCRRTALFDLLRLLDRTCRRENLAYAVSGELMDALIREAKAEEEGETAAGMISDPARIRGEILMEREHRDRLFALLKENPGEGREHLRAEEACAADGSILRSAGRLIWTARFEGDMGEIPVRWEVEILPLEEVPADEEERKSFLREVCIKSGEYARRSGALHAFQAKKNRQTLLKKLVNSGRELLTRGGPGGGMKKENREYLRFLNRYAGSGSGWLGRIEFIQESPFRRSRLFPAGEIEIGDLRVFIPAEPEYFSARGSEDCDEEVKAERTELVKELASFCRRENLSCFPAWDLASAISHGEGIRGPVLRSRWDLGLPAADYRRLAERIRTGKTPFVLADRSPGRAGTAALETGVILEKWQEEHYRCRDYAVTLVPFYPLPDGYGEAMSLCTKAHKAERRLRAVIAYEKGERFVRLEKGESSLSDEEKLRRVGEAWEGKPTRRMFTLREGSLRLHVREDIFPLEERDFEGTAVLCAKNPFLWHEEEDPDWQEHAAKQKTELLRRIDAWCSQRNLRYFAVGDLLSAAVVYGDVFPDGKDRVWEIGLIRKEYDRMVEELRADGGRGGIAVEEYLDPEEKIPYKTKQIVYPGRISDDVRIGLIPLDKVPLDFYLGTGLTNMVKDKSDFYHQLLRNRRYGYRKLLLPYMGEKGRACEEYIRTADPLREHEQIENMARSFGDTDRPFLYNRIAFRTWERGITGEELFPVQRKPFRGIGVNCPRDTSVWQMEEDGELQRQVKAVQKADLILLKEFDRVCGELGLGYFICGGTMLGYMRHGGFIPWDNDVDVAMLRADYDRFLAEAGPLLGERIFLQTRQTDETIPYLFSKLRLDDTLYETSYSRDREYHEGICMDIFPFDFIPNDEGERKKLARSVKMIARVQKLTAYDQRVAPGEEPEARNDAERQCIEYEKQVLKKAWEVNLADTQQDYLGEATRYNCRAERDGLTTVASFVPDYTWIDLKDLLPYQRGMFAGVEVSVPKRPDVFLKMQYGDYMKMPPPHARIAHRLERWKTWEEEGTASSPVEGKEQTS